MEQDEPTESVLLSPTRKYGDDEPEEDDSPKTDRAVPSDDPGGYGEPPISRDS